MAKAAAAQVIQRPEELVPVKLGAAHIHTTERFLWDAIASGKVPAHRFGKRIVRVKLSEIEAAFSDYNGGAADD